MKHIAIIILSFFPLFFSTQNESRFWYFGNLAGLDFVTNPPTILTNGLNVAEGVGTISDNSGNLLFYCNGGGVINSNHMVMANGGGMNGNPGSTQGAMIVKQPGNNTNYYVFTLGQNGTLPGQCYSIVDMSLAAGLGSVTVKNVPIYTLSCEKQVAVRHCNGIDVWILSHEFGTRNFRAYLLDKNGLSTTPVVSTIGEIPIGVGSTAVGQMKISPDGRKLAVATATSSTPLSNGLGGFHLFDFDPSSGVISNSLVLGAIPDAYGVEFSPDGKKLYGSTSPGGGSTLTSKFFQWDVCASGTAAILASQYSMSIPQGTLAGALQKANNGKIYMALSGRQELAVIHNPNAAGAAMGFTLNGQSVAPKYSGLGLPNFINPFVKTPPAPFSQSLSCNQVSFLAPVNQSYNGSCNLYSYLPSGYLWDFGDPASGAANSSTLTNPSHIYAATGTYTVKLVLQGPCFNDTLVQSVNITTLGPNPAITGPTLICKGDRYTYTVSGGTSYQWSTGSTATAVALQPTQTTVYTCTATQNGCSVAKAFTVTVNPCTGIESIEDLDLWKVYPNPVNTELRVETALPSMMNIYDLNGRLVLAAELQQGENHLDTSPLQTGVYSYKLSNTSTSRIGRLIKIE